MSIITIQCRLIAPEATRHQLWDLMAEKNTPLINELLRLVPQQPEFDKWLGKGELPEKIINTLCEPLKTIYSNQPSRFYTSATSLVKETYKAWFQVQKRLQDQLQKKQRWLDILKSDDELLKQSNSNLETLKNKARELLTIYPTTRNLLDAYHQTQEILEKSAISYLLKNRGRLPQKPENQNKLAQRRRKLEITIERLNQKLESRYPKGRDLTGQKWLDTLIQAATTVPQDNQQFKYWQDILLTKTKSIPFPISYYTNGDLRWSKNEQNRLCVCFNGLSKLSFQIYCDQRHLKWFERFYQDQEVKRASKNQHSSALFTLRSAQIAWQEGEGKEEPWNLHHLTLFCSLDTRLWSVEGTEEIRQEKAATIIKILSKTGQKDDLTKQQQNFVKRKNSTLARINNPFPRPSQPLYQGKSEILIGVAMRLEQPATIAVVDGTTGRVITYRNIKQLLGDNYCLLHRQRQEKKRQSHKRHKAQRKDASTQCNSSELGQYIDRLLAKAIVELAKSYHAGSIVLPRLGDMREVVQAEIQAKAEAKIPGSAKAQANYAKQYRTNIHQWSYGRLMDNISAQASKVGIAIERGTQLARASPLEQAKALAIEAYQTRLCS